MDYTVHGTLQARILEWVAFPFSRGIFLTQGSNSGPCLQKAHGLMWETDKNIQQNIIKAGWRPTNVGWENRESPHCLWFGRLSLGCEGWGEFFTTHPCPLFTRCQASFLEHYAYYFIHFFVNCNSGVLNYLLVSFVHSPISVFFPSHVRAL